MVKLERKLIGAEDGGRRLSSGRRQYVRDHEGAQNEVAEHHCEASQMSGDSSELSVTVLKSLTLCQAGCAASLGEDGTSEILRVRRTKLLRTLEASRKSEEV